MKKQILLLITLAIAICGCQKEENYPSAGNQDVVGAVIASETGTKTTMNGTQVVWEEADEISIFSQAGNAFINNKYTLQSGGNTTNATFSGHFEGESKVAAFYPYYADATYTANGIAFTLPATYTYADDSKNNKAPMAAVMTSASNDIVFLNAGALMTITVRNIPAGYNVAKLYVDPTSSDPALAGVSVITFEGGIPTMKVADAADAKEVTINFTASDAVSTKTFHFPIPVGNYTTLTFAISDGAEIKVLKTKALNAQRNKQYKTTITLDSVTGSIPVETTMEDVEEDLKTEPNVTIDNVSSSDDATISLPAQTAGKEVNINFESIDASVTEVTINSADDIDTQVPTVLNITVPTIGDQTKINVDMPNTTVTITAADTGETTTIPELTASTADQTLIVESGVTIEKLIVEKGNVRVKKGAKILAIERTKTNTDALTYVIYEEGATIPESVADNKIFLVEAEVYVVLPSINGVYYKNLQYAVDAAKDGDVIVLESDITEDVTVTQKADTKITIQGNGNKYNGVITVDGKSQTYITAGLAIENLHFAAETISADACIRLGNGTNATRYTCNVTISGCTFDVSGAVGVKSYTGGDKNLTITGCTATDKTHSLVQAKGIDGILIENCKVYSKNGMNFNNSTNVTVNKTTADVKGYAVRFGESSGGSGAAEVYSIQNSTLKSACDEGDAVIILRGTADYSTLAIEKTTIEGQIEITNAATDAVVIIDGVATVSSTDGLAKAITKGVTTINLQAGTYAMPSVAKGKYLTVNGVVGQPDSVVINVVPGGQGEAGGQLDYNLDGSTVTFNNLTIKTNSQLYAGYARLSAKYNKCIIQNTYNLGTGSSAFNDCTFNITNEYLRVGGAYSAVFDGCTFNTEGRAILVFQDGTNVAQTVIVKDCTFNATAAANTGNGIHVAAVSIDGTNGTYEVSLEGTNKVDSDFNGLWQIKAGETNVTVKESSTAE